MTRLIEAAQTPRDRALFEMMYATGARVSEIVGMRVEQLNREEHSIKVLGKGQKERLVLFGVTSAPSNRCLPSRARDGPTIRSPRRREESRNSHTAVYRSNAKA